jgi:hypothetical protein
VVRGIGECPVAGAVTFTFTVQTLLAATVPFENEIEPAPRCGANVARRIHYGAARRIRDHHRSGRGRKRVREAHAGDRRRLGLVIVKVRAETPFTVAGSGLNALAMMRVKDRRSREAVDVEKSEL